MPLRNSRNFPKFSSLVKIQASRLQCWKSRGNVTQLLGQAILILFFFCSFALRIEHIFMTFCVCFRTEFRTAKGLQGAQWLSGRVLDSRPKGRGFKPHRRHYVVALEQDTFMLA